MILVVVVASVGIFDAVKLSVEERRSVYGILLALGMNGKKILKYVVAEFLLMLVLGVLVGWSIGILGYMAILEGIEYIFQITLPSALALDEYYKPYIALVTKNPWIWSALTAIAVALVGILGVTVDLLSMTPVRMEMSAVRKRKRRGHSRNLYTLLNRYTGRNSRMQQWIPHFIICIIMAVSVFGFLFFQEKAVQDTDGMSEKIEAARIKGMDYYMKHTNAVFNGSMQYMHQSGVTEEIYQKLRRNKYVDVAKGVVINHSTSLIYDRDHMAANILKPQTEYTEASGSNTQAKIDAQMNEKYFRFMGIDTDRQEVFHVPTVGIRDEDIEHFRSFVVSGEIHEQKLQSGEEVLIVLTEESLSSYFVPGEELPLYDVIRPEGLDNSTEILIGQMPGEYRQEDKAYTVSVDGVTRKQWCYDTLKKCPVRIGAVLCIDAQEDSFFFDDGNGSYQVNVMAGKDAFRTWGLPNRNYTSVGVKLKNMEDSARFEKVWMQVLQSAGYMDSIDVYSILQEKERIQHQVMAIFYAVLGVLLLIGLLCTGNSIAMRIRHMEMEQKTLYYLGMTKRRLLLLYVRRYSCIGLAGAVFSMIPAAGYSLLVRYAERLTDEAVQNDTIDMLYAQKPWVEYIPNYDMLTGRLPIAAITAFVVAVILICLLVLVQSGWLNNVLMNGEKEEE